jgi:nucleoside-diphosphate-sugar epimerase
MTESEKNASHVVLGTGQLGLAVMDALLTNDEKVAIVNRSGKVTEPTADTVSVLQADLSDPDSVANVTSNADTVFFCAAPPYTDWPEQFPVMTQAVIDGVSRTGAKLVFGDNLYMYGPTGSKPIREDLPYAATGSKGTARAQVANILMDADKAGQVQVAIGRASDFFGPRVTGSVLGERVFGAALEGTTVDVLGNIDLPHTYTYIRDFASALVTLSSREEAYGQAWNVPNAKTLTTQQWLDMIGEQVGHPLKTRSAGALMITVLGLFNPALREMKEMMYEFTEPYIVDDTKFLEAFGGEPTEPKVAVEKTLDWYRQHWSQ